MSKYILPDFNRLKPKRIEKLDNKLKTSKLYNPEIELKPHKSIYLTSLNKLLKTFIKQRL